MKLSIKVTPGAKKNLLKQEGDLIKVYLTAPPVEGKANDALIKFLAEYYGVRSSMIDILKGLKSRQKIVNIEGI
ncbi:MAG: DUF167 domain-containing protein [Candidatus Omnitrophica bacterium]|nr:DUF167 domain-containing protein [Candidatus Omnitrophota bacterium]